MKSFFTFLFLLYTFIPPYRLMAQDVSGKPGKEVNFENGTYSSSVLFQYNSRGLITKKIQLDTVQNTVISLNYFSYDEKDSLIAEVVMNASLPVPDTDLITRYYYTTGSRLGITQEKSNGFINWEKTASHDSSGYLTHDSLFYWDPYKSNWYLNQVTRFYYSHPAGKLIEKLNFYFDQNTKEVSTGSRSIRTYSGSELLSIRSDTFPYGVKKWVNGIVDSFYYVGNNGSYVDSTFDGSIRTKICIYDYDISHRLIKYSEKAHLGNIWSNLYSKEYEYDSKGNLLSCETIDGDITLKTIYAEFFKPSVTSRIRQHFFSDLSIYPNPVVDHLNIEMADHRTIFSMKVFGQDGRVFLSGNGVDQLHFEKLLPGNYFLFIETDEGPGTIELIKD